MSEIKKRPYCMKHNTSYWGDVCPDCRVASESKLTDLLSVYVVTAYRWGGRENHSYLVGVYDNQEKALKVASEHNKYRGGKYDCEVMKTPINPDYGDRTRRVVLGIHTDRADITEINKCHWCGAEKPLHDEEYGRYYKIR